MEIAVASKGEVTVRFVTVLVAIVCLLGVGAPLGSCSAANEGKLCCDEACSQPISYGRTVTRFISKSKEHLSFPGSAIVTVYAKGVGQEMGEGFPVDLWEAEIQGKRGLIREDMVRELSRSCSPKVVPKPSEVPTADHTHGDSEVETPPLAEQENSNLQDTDREAGGNQAVPNEEAPSATTNSNHEWAYNPTISGGNLSHVVEDNNEVRSANEEAPTPSSTEEGSFVEVEVPGQSADATESQVHVGDWQVEGDDEFDGPDNVLEGEELRIVSLRNGHRGAVYLLYGDMAMIVLDNGLRMQVNYDYLFDELDMEPETFAFLEDLDLGSGYGYEEEEDDLQRVEPAVDHTVPQVTQFPSSPSPVIPPLPQAVEPPRQDHLLSLLHVQVPQTTPNIAADSHLHREGGGVQQESSVVNGEGYGDVVAEQEGYGDILAEQEGDRDVLAEQQGDRDVLAEQQGDGDIVAEREGDGDGVAEQKRDGHIVAEQGGDPSFIGVGFTMEEQRTAEHREEEGDEEMVWWEREQGEREEGGDKETVWWQEREVQVEEGGEVWWEEHRQAQVEEEGEKKVIGSEERERQEEEAERERTRLEEKQAQVEEPQVAEEGEKELEEREAHEEVKIQQETTDDEGEGSLPSASPALPHTQEKEADKWYEDPKWRAYPPERAIVDHHGEDWEDDDQTPSTGAGEWLLQFLPEPLAAWVMDEGGVMFPVAIVTTILCLALPTCCLYCRSRKQSTRQGQQLKAKTAALRKVEGKLEKVREERGSLKTQLRGVEERCRGVEEELQAEKHASAGLHQTKTELEAHYQAMANSLSATQQEVARHHLQIEQLNIQLAHEQKQLSAQIGEKDTALLQVAHLSSQLQLFEQRVQELEAAKEQLEHDLFSTQNTLDQLHTEHERVRQEKEGLEARCSSLESELQLVKEDAGTLREAVTEKDQELEALRECVRQVTEEEEGEAEANGGEEVDGEGMDQGTVPKETRRESQLVKIQAMLDTTKAQTQLREVTETRDQLALQLQQNTTILEETRGENARVHQQVTELESQLTEVNHNYEEAQLRIKHLSEFFEQREHSLHRKLGAEEVARQLVQSRESEAQQRADAVEQEREREREELKDLRRQMVEIEKSLKEQVLENEKRAENAYAQLRKTENDLRVANLEITDLHKRLGRRPSPPHPRMLRPLPMNMHMPGPDARPRGGSRPPSTTQFPRTSSPGPLNETQPELRTDHSLPLPLRRPHSACERDPPNGRGTQPRRTSPLSEMTDGSSSSPPPTRPTDDSHREIPVGDRSLPAAFPPPHMGFRRYPPPRHRGPPPPPMGARMRPRSNPPLSELEGRFPPPAPPGEPLPPENPGERRPPPLRRSPPPFISGRPPIEPPPLRRDYPPPPPRGPPMGDRYGRPRPPPPPGSYRGRDDYYPRPPPPAPYGTGYGRPVSDAGAPLTGHSSSAAQPTPTSQLNPTPVGSGVPVDHTHQTHPHHNHVQGYGQQGHHQLVPQQPGAAERRPEV